MSSSGILDRITANWPAKILSVVAAIVLYLAFRIGSLEERFFSVPLSIVTNESYVPVDDVPRSVRITVRGPAEEIFLIIEDDIEAYVDLTAQVREGRFRVPVLVRKLGTAELVDIELFVDPIEVTITQELRVTRTVDIIPSTRGFPAEGFELTAYTLTPSSVEIVGPRSSVEAVSAARTDEVDLAGRAESFALRVRAHIDAPRSEIVGSDLVEFRGTVRPVVVSRSFDGVAIVPVGLPVGFRGEYSESAGSIRLRGTYALVRNLTSADVRLVLDCSGIGAPGEYELPVIAALPDGVESVSILPGRVIVVVSASAEERR